MMALCISAFGGGLFFAWSQMRPEKGLKDPVLYGNFGGHMGSERPKRRGGVFRRLLNLVLIVYWLWFSAEDTPSAKIENGTPCSDQFSGPAPDRLGSPSRSRHRPGIRAAETAAKPAPCRGSGPVTVSDGALAGHIGRGENPTVAGRKSHRNPTMQRGWGIALEGSFPYASAISAG